MAIAGKVPLTVRITPEARKILQRVAKSIVCDEEDRLPLGRMITAMIVWFEENTEWDEIKDAILAEWGREVQKRRVRDRQRKRRKPSPCVARTVTAES
jgi:hypothetical protein